MVRVVLAVVGAQAGVARAVPVVAGSNLAGDVGAVETVTAAVVAVIAAGAGAVGSAKGAAVAPTGWPTSCRISRRR